MQLRWLRLRYWLGWGHSIDHLRFRAHLCFAATRAVLFMLPIMTAALLALSWSEEKRIEASPSAVRVLISLYALGASILAVLVFVGLHQMRLLQRTSRVGIELVVGQCYALFGDAPFRLFAKVGHTDDTAKWYVMPIQWDTLLKPNGESLELEAYMPTGYVTQLRSIGTRRLELTSEIAPDQVAYASATTATRQAPQEIRRYIRKVCLHGWGASPRIVFWSGLVVLISGVLIFLLPYSLFILLRSSSVSFQQVMTSLLELIPLDVGGVLAIVWSVGLIRTARRGLRARTEPFATLEGVITFALAQRDEFSKAYRPSIYIELDADDGSTPIFRIPSELAHRVPVGARVRVECNPATEVVTNVMLLEPDMDD